MRRSRRVAGSASALGALFAILATGVQAEDDKAAFVALERRLLAAPRLCVRFAIESSGVLTSDLVGRARMDRGHAPSTLLAKGRLAEAPVDLSLLAAREDMWVGRSRNPLPPALHEALVIGFTRMGLLHNLARLSADQPPDRGDGGVREWVQVGIVSGPGPFEFDISVGGELAGSAKLWLDERGLPLRRHQTVRFPSGSMEVVERYTRFELDCPT